MDFLDHVIKIESSAINQQLSERVNYDWDKVLLFIDPAPVYGSPGLGLLLVTGWRTACVGW